MGDYLEHKEEMEDNYYGDNFKPSRRILVIKKDGSKEEFNVQKVIIAVGKSAYRALTKFTELVFGYPIMQSILGFFGILFLLLGLYSVLRGYTKACGYEGILFITDIVESIILIVGGVFITRFFSAYGTKVV